MASRPSIPQDADAALAAVSPGPSSSASQYPPDTVAVFDLDGTLTRRDTYRAVLLRSLVHYPSNIPRLARLVGPTLRFKLGRLDNTALKRAYLRELLARLPTPVLSRLAGSFVDHLLASGMRPQAMATLAGHREAGHTTVLLTASLDFYVEDIARRLRFDHCLCTRTARRRDNTLTGELSTANCYGPEKHARLTGIFGDDRRDAFFVGYGDHRSDLPLLTRLDRGFLVNASGALRAAAEEAGLGLLEWQ